MLKPNGDRLLIEQDSIKEEKLGALVVPENSREKPSSGIVIAVGDGRILDNGNVIPVKFKVGDHVFYEKYGSSSLKYKDKEYSVVKESSIIAVEVNE